MKLILVEWEDPCTYAIHGWVSREDTDNDHFLAIPCVTVGILYQENKDRIAVTLNSNEDSVSSVQTIPKSCIKRIRYLKVG